MKEFDPVLEFIFDYITVVAECTFAIAVIGSIFAGEADISFLYFFCRLDWRFCVCYPAYRFI